MLKLMEVVEPVPVNEVSMNREIWNSVLWANFMEVMLSGRARQGRDCSNEIIFRLSVMGFETNAVISGRTQRIQCGGGETGQAVRETVADPIDVVLLPVDMEEKQRAGIDENLLARESYYNLDDGEVKTIQTLKITGYENVTFNVKSVEEYQVPGFPEVGVATVTKS